MKGRNKILLIALGFLLIIIAGCENKHKEVPTVTQPTTLPKIVQAKLKAVSAKPAVKPASKIKVTFIELGSVNCTPCKMMKGIMDEITEEYQGQVKVIFYDVWTEAGKPYAEKYKISGIPYQIFLDENGEIYYRHLGFFPKDDLVRILELKGVK